MDRSELSTAIIQELGAVLTSALTEAAPALAAADLDGIEQRLQDVGRQVMGQVVEQVVAARATAQAEERPVCARCAGEMRRVARARRRQLQGLVGDYTLRRPYYVCDACHRGQAPLDAQLGLDGGTLSPGLSRVICRLGIEDSFEETLDQVAETLRVLVPEEAVRRITEGIGAVAEAEQRAGIAQAQRGAPVACLLPAAQRPTLLVVEVDGVHVPLEDGWHEMKVGRVAPLGPHLQVDRDSGRTHLALGPSGYCAGLESAEVHWYRVYAEACRQGLGATVRLVVALGDGAEWIWTHARPFLALPGVEVVEIVDIYHAYEHLWTVGNAAFGTGSKEVAAWVEPLKDRLYAEGVAPVLQALAALVPPTEVAAEEVRLAIGYFTDHAARMDYPRFVARQFPIGSGAVESACKTLIEQRTKQAGMRWSRAGIQAVASLRALHRSGRWAAFWQTHPQRCRPLVFPRPPVAPPGRAEAPPGAQDNAATPPPPVPAAPPAGGPPPPPLPAARPRPAASHPWRHATIGRARCA